MRGPQLEQAREKFLAMRDELDAEMNAVFREYDRTRDRGALARLRGILNRRKYIRNLVNEVEKELLAPQIAGERANRPGTAERSPAISWIIRYVFLIPDRFWGSQSRERRRHRPRHHEQPGRLHGLTAQPEIIPGQDGDKLVPSVVSLTDPARSWSAMPRGSC